MVLTTFLIAYCLFTTFIRNRLHLSEPPIALLVGIILGPRGLGWLTPSFRATNGPDWVTDTDGIGGWGWGDDVVQEAARVIVGIQVFAVGVELPRFYASKHWRSVVMLLGPVMTFGWVVCAAFVAIIFRTDIPTAMVVAACLTPTDPVLAASILSNSQFSTRVPERIKNLLSAESGCNDGISFPFLYIGLALLNHRTAAEALRQWFLLTILWQCVLGTAIGLAIGTAFNKVLRFSDSRGYIDAPGFTVFYLLLAILSVGVGSILGSDDFLVAFGAGYGFARDGWFTKKTHGVQLPQIIDLMLNSAMFVYLGSIIPWYAFEPQGITPSVTPGRLLAFLLLVLLFRRIPIVVTLYPWIPDIRTLPEALFAGHFGPMGLGGVFLAIEARAVLETGTSLPLRHPEVHHTPYTTKEHAIEIVWPLVVFIVMGSTLVHGLSVAAMSVANHLWRDKSQRAPVLAAETDPLGGMVHEEGGEVGSEIGDEDVEERMEEEGEGRGQVRL